MDQVEEARFTRFVVQSGDRLLHAAELLVGDRQRAEDLLQVALTRVCLAWPRVVEPEAYARRVLARLAVDGWRRRRVREVALVPGTDAVAPGDAHGDADRRAVVLSALVVLTPRERAVVMLRYYEDLSEAEIAAALGIAAGTVKSTAARALARLRGSGRLEDCLPVSGSGQHGTGGTT